MSAIPPRFTQWLKNSSTGDVVMYMQADHASRRPDIAAFFRQAAVDGLVFLFQERVKDGFPVFNYKARRLTPEAGEQLRPFYIDEEGD